MSVTFADVYDTLRPHDPVPVPVPRLSMGARSEPHLLQSLGLWAEASAC